MYNSKCSKNRPDDAFYLRALAKPRGDVWYTCTPVGHNFLSKSIHGLFKAAGLEGHYTNHSLRATSATRLFDAGVDEQLIMSRTGHSSTASVRSYKRISESLQDLTSSVLNSGVEKKCKTEEEVGSGELLPKPKECASSFPSIENPHNEVVFQVPKKTVSLTYPSVLVPTLQ